MEIPTFKSAEGSWSCASGTIGQWSFIVFDVECDRERPRDDPGLRHQIVRIDDREYKCLSVLSKALGETPIRKGERIGILVEVPR